jgi:3-phenylpropionate/trans-cinnamate dioxygenase ferredoxin reductase subunit
VAHEFVPKRHLLVIGGGYIGLEIAAVARKKNLYVTLVEAEDRILKRVASIQTAKFFKDLHNENDVEIIEGRSIRKLTGKKGFFISAVLDDGNVISADFAVIGIGVKPSSSLASEAGLEVDNGIKVDCFCQTSDTKILSAGDCTNFPYGSSRLRLESVGNAIDQAEVAAMTALGFKKPYHAKPWFWSDQYNVKLQIAGLSSEYDQVIERRENKVASYWYFKNKKLIAVDAVNDGRAYMVAKRLIELGKSPDPFILSDYNFDLKLLLKSN